MGSWGKGGDRCELVPDVCFRWWAEDVNEVIMVTACVSQLPRHRHEQRRINTGSRLLILEIREL